MRTDDPIQDHNNRVSHSDARNDPPPDQEEQDWDFPRRNLGERVGADMGKAATVLQKALRFLKAGRRSHDLREEIKADQPGTVIDMPEMRDLFCPVSGGCQQEASF